MSQGELEYVGLGRIEGPLQYGNGAGGNLDGCAPFAAGSLAGKIVLVDRGTCTFTLKIKNIGQAGGLAGVIGMTTQDDPFTSADGGDRPIDIPGFMISQAKSNILKSGLPAVHVVLDPANGLGVVSYEYCLDTSNDGACSGSWVSTGSTTSAPLAGLAMNTVYYWQVRAVNAFGTTGADGGTWWNFTTGPIQVTFRSVGANDGWVLESGENSSRGGTLDASATTARLGDDASDRQYRSILDFNTASLPNNAVVVGATLRIKKKSIVGTDPFTTHSPLNADIKTGRFGQSALQLSDFQAAASQTAVATLGPLPVAGWYTAGLVSSAWARVNRIGHTQFRLLFNTGDNDDLANDYLVFHTGNATLASKPQLIVSYYLP